MIITSIYEFSKNIAKYLIMSVLMAAICFLGTMVISITEYQHGRFAPFSYLDKKIDDGFIVFDDTSSYEGEALKYCDKYCVDYLSGMSGNLSVNICCYDEWILGNWKPRLKSGKWITEAKHSSNTINVVCQSNDMGIGVGSELDFTFYKLSDEKTAGGEEITVPISLKARVVGVLQENTDILRGHEYHAGKESYDICYDSLTTMNNGIAFLTDRKDVEYLEAFGINDSWQIYSFHNNVDEEIKNSIKRDMLNNSNHAGTDWQTFMDNSKSFFYGIILTYVPVMLLSFILAIIFIVTITKINIMDNIKDYSIYCLCGADLRDCTIMSVICIALCTFVSTIFFAIFTLLYDANSKKYNINYEFRNGSIFLAALFYIMLIMIMIISLKHYMNRLSIKEMLIESRYRL